MACRCLSLLTYWSLPTAEATELFGTVKVEGYVPKARENPTMVLYKKRLWTYGGLLPNNPLEKIEHEIYNDLNCFDIDSQTWIKVAADGAPKPKLGPRAVLDFAGTMWVWGGGAVGEDDAPGLMWSEVKCQGDVPSARMAHGAAITSSGEMWVYGGQDRDRKEFEDLYLISGFEMC
eukprot:Skav205978  [mRNA]  locus=scaffold442:932362:933404:- [translate_table: standard]